MASAAGGSGSGGGGVGSRGGRALTKNLTKDKDKEGKEKEDDETEVEQQNSEDKARRLEHLFRKIERSDHHLSRFAGDNESFLSHSSASQFDDKSSSSFSSLSTWRSNPSAEGDAKRMFLDYLAANGDDGSDDPFESLYFLWLNERVAPDLLPYDEHTVQRITSRCAAAEKPSDELKRLTNKSRLTDVDRVKIQRLQLEECLQHLQVERVKYLLAAYHRTRLRKIEKHVFYYCKSADYFERMSNAEQSHAMAFTNLLAEYFNKVFLQQRHAHPPHQFVLPVELHGLTEENEREDMLSKPDLDRFVVMRARKEFDFRENESAGMDDENSQRLYPGDIFVSRYRLCQTYLREKKIQFI